MQLTFTQLDSQDILYSKEYPADFISETGLEEVRSSFYKKGVKADFKAYRFEGVHIMTYELCTEGAFTVLAKSDRSLYWMIFCLEGRIKIHPLNKEEDAILLKKDKGVLIGEQGLSEMELTQCAKVVSICFTTECVERLNLKDYLVSLLPFSAIFWIIPAGKMILHAIGNCTYPLIMKRIFLESKVLELLFLQFPLESAVKQAQVNCSLAEQDFARIRQAKEIIEQNVQRPYSLIDLSRKVGLNDYKLKKGFKALLGVTVFGYLHELRMEQAKQMLLDKKSVNQVSYDIGYKNPHHFSAAFKKKYGIVPSQLYKSGLFLVTHLGLSDINLFDLFCFTEGVAF